MKQDANQRAAKTANSCAPNGSVVPIVAHGVRVTGAEGQTLLDDISLTVEGNGLTVILGPNGAGKSLLLRVLTGLVTPSIGTLSWGGSHILGPRVKSISFVFQKPVLFRRSVLENMKFVLSHAGVTKTDIEARARAALAHAGLDHLADAPARRLSGGEQQRVAIARALAINPEILFLDEPTAHLDPASTAAIEEMIGNARTNNTRIVHVTHDLSQARRLADDVIFLHRGQMVETAPADRFFDKPTAPQAQAFVAGELVL